MHNIIKCENLSLSFSNKVCFENFSVDIFSEDRIAIIGRNGSGKSSLLKIISNTISSQKQSGVSISAAYIPQIISDTDSLSGGERFNQKLSEALGRHPSLLLLDEPTNHLDIENRRSLMRMLNAFHGALLVVTHDEELLEKCTDILWHIDNGKITVFRGKYRDYVENLGKQRKNFSDELKLLEREKKSMHEKLMKEQQKASKSKSAGEKKIQNKKWMKSTADLKAMKAEKSQGKNLKNIDEKKRKITEKMSEIWVPEEIIPKFYLPFQHNIADRTVVHISDGSIGYANEKVVARNINLSLMSHERIAIVGRNGSGKTTLLKAIIGDTTVVKSGDWHLPNPCNIGYLDQHYSNLDQTKSALEIISDTNPAWSHAEIRRHLNDFLFRKNEEVNTAVSNLSGGESAMLSLAQIAAKVPKLLILDEITNNIDIETRNHIIEVLREYPSALIVVSHDEAFLNKIGIEKTLSLAGSNIFGYLFRLFARAKQRIISLIFSHFVSEVLQKDSYILG